jgi:hypothetical protein
MLHFIKKRRVAMSISPILQNGLTYLSMLDNDKPKDGLKFVDSIYTEKNPYIKLHLYEAEKHNAKAVYFRYFDEKPPIPQIYIYEKDQNINIDNLHKELWSSCKVPIFFIFSQTEIKIFNSMSKKNVEETADIKPLEIIDIAMQFQNNIYNKRKIFQANMFDNGEFWNTDIARNNFKYEHSAYSSLINNLKITKEYLINSSSMPENIINSLLVKSILIKYLEERSVFPSDYWRRFCENAKCFIDVCKDNKSFLNVFDDLHKHFNGGVFEFSQEERSQILESDLTQFVYFLEGDINLNTAQKHFWNLYSFEHLPIELISNIYELFLKKEEKNKNGIVYTPIMLVNFLIDEVMPLDKPQKHFKVIDPSCGSGVFLVAAYKRLIQWYMLNEDFKKSPDIDNVLRDILKESIYGVDKEGEAVKLSQFSLALTICDTLSPDIIWEKLQLDDLIKKGNLIADDFFNVLSKKELLGNFDLVIGNPPFISSLTESAEKINERGNAERYERPNLPDKKLAFLFLEQSFELCKRDGYVCMIQQSAFLYNNNAENFRKYLLQRFNAKQIVDFAGLNNSLFKGANVAVSAVFFENKEPDIENGKLLHVIAKETFETKEKLYFDLSYYDFHWMSYREAIHNKYIWKCNLFGGSRTIEIVKRFRKLKTFGEFIEDKIKNCTWRYGEGFILGKDGECASYLYGSKVLKTRPNALKEEGIDWENGIGILKHSNFHRPKDEKLYQSPLLIIRETFSKNTILSDYVDVDIAYNHSFIGISAPNNDENKDELKYILKNLKQYSKEFNFYIITTSGSIGINRATAFIKQNIDMLPYPDNLEEIRMSRIEQYFADDVINYMLDWINGKNNLPIFKDVTKKQLEEYQEVYHKLLNSIYDNYKLLYVQEMEQFILLAFCYGEKSNSDFVMENKSQQDIVYLINNKYSINIHIKRIIKLYDKNVIYIIKPKQYRFWLKSIAVRDADETCADLIRMRYKHC